MSDHQFSIEIDGRRCFIDIFGGPEEYFIEVHGKLIRFEWSDRFGPMPIKKDGSEMRSIGPRHAFWRVASLWNLQGRRIENDRCVWHEPKKPVYERRGGQLIVIDDGEPGHDW